MWSADQGLSRWGTQAAVWLVTARSPNGAGDSAIPLPGRHPPLHAPTHPLSPPQPSDPTPAPLTNLCRDHSAQADPSCCPAPLLQSPPYPFSSSLRLFSTLQEGLSSLPQCTYTALLHVLPSPSHLQVPFVPPGAQSPSVPCVCAHISLFTPAELYLSLNPLLYAPTPLTPTLPPPVGLPSPPSLWVLSKNNISEGLGKKKTTPLFIIKTIKPPWRVSIPPPSCPIHQLFLPSSWHTATRWPQGNVLHCALQSSGIAGSD